MIEVLFLVQYSEAFFDFLIWEISSFQEDLDLPCLWESKATICLKFRPCLPVSHGQHFCSPCSVIQNQPSALPSETPSYKFVHDDQGYILWEMLLWISKGKFKNLEAPLGKIWIPCWGIIHLKHFYRTQKLRKYQMCWLYFVLILCYIPEPVSFIKWQFC